MGFLWYQKTVTDGTGRSLQLTKFCHKCLMGWLITLKLNWEMFSNSAVITSRLLPYNIYDLEYKLPILLNVDPNKNFKEPWTYRSSHFNERTCQRSMTSLFSKSILQKLCCKDRCSHPVWIRSYSLVQENKKNREEFFSKRNKTFGRRSILLRLNIPICVSFFFRKLTDSSAAKIDVHILYE